MFPEYQPSYRRIYPQDDRNCYSLRHLPLRVARQELIGNKSLIAQRNMVAMVFSRLIHPLQKIIAPAGLIFKQNTTSVKIRVTDIPPSPI
jgi:hypothetical protein